MPLTDNSILSRVIMLHAISTTPFYAVARTVLFTFLLDLPLSLLYLAPLLAAPSAAITTAVDTAVAAPCVVTTTAVDAAAAAAAPSAVTTAAVVTATATVVASATSGGGITLVFGTRPHPPTLLTFGPSLPLALPHLLHLLSSVIVNERRGTYYGSAGGGRVGRRGGRRKGRREGHTRNISRSQDEQQKEGGGARRVRDREGEEEEGDTKSLRHEGRKRQEKEARQPGCNKEGGEEPRGRPVHRLSAAIDAVGSDAAVGLPLFLPPSLGSRARIAGSRTLYPVRA